MKTIIYATLALVMAAMLSAISTPGFADSSGYQGADQLPNMQEIMKLVEEAQRHVQSINTADPERGLKKMVDTTTKILNLSPGQYDVPCSMFNALPFQGRHCFPLNIKVSWNIADSYTDFEDKYFQAQWRIEEHSKGELLANGSASCRELTPRCIKSFEIVAPGMGGKFTQASRNIRITEASIRYPVPVPGTDRDREFKADTAQFSLPFYTDSVMDNSAFSWMRIYPDGARDNGYLDSPEFQWKDQFGEWYDKNDIGGKRLEYDSVASESQANRIFVPPFGPKYKQVFELLADRSENGKELSRSIPVSYVADNGSTRRTIKGEAHYQISLRPPGKFKVSEGTFHATRKSVTTPYKPRSTTFELKNAGKDELQFKVAVSANWLTVNPAAGRLQPGQNTTVKVSLTPAADALKDGKHEARIFFEDISNNIRVSRNATLSNREKWRLSIIQKNDLVMGSGDVWGGVDARVRTDVDIEIEDGKFKQGTASAKFLSINGISSPPGVFDCIVHPNGMSIDRPAYSVKGAVNGSSVVVDIPENTYRIYYGCLTDRDQLEHFYQHRFKNYAQRQKKLRPKWAKQINWEATIKKWAKGAASRPGTIRELRFDIAMYPDAGGSVRMPLQNKTTWLGGSSKKSVDWEVLKMQRLE